MTQHSDKMPSSSFERSNAKRRNLERAGPIFLSPIQKYIDKVHVRYLHKLDIYGPMRLPQIVGGSTEKVLPGIWTWPLEHPFGQTRAFIYWIKQPRTISSISRFVNLWWGLIIEMLRKKKKGWTQKCLMKNDYLECPWQAILLVILLGLFTAGFFQGLSRAIKDQLENLPLLVMSVLESCFLRTLTVTRLLPLVAGLAGYMESCWWGLSSLTFCLTF